MSKSYFAKTISALLVSLFFTATSVQAQWSDVDWFTISGEGAEHNYVTLQKWNGVPSIWEIWAESNLWEGFDDSGDWGANNVAVPPNVLVQGAQLRFLYGANMNRVVLQNGAVVKDEIDKPSGSIQELSLGGGSVFQSGDFTGSISKINFNGDVDALETDIGGSGMIRITEKGAGLGFNTVNAGTIDLTGGNVVVNLVSDQHDFGFIDYLSAVSDNEVQLNLSLLFGNSTLENWESIALLSFVWNDGSSYDLIGVNGLADNWRWASGTAALVYTLPTSAATPEPATLALFGLGLTGLAVLRRRRK